jgi:hypothetical protein
MTEQAKNEFFEALSQDEQMRRELESRSTEHGVPASELEQFAREKGYDFSVEEESGELNEEQLEQATGGLTPVKAASFDELKVEWYRPPDPSMSKLTTYIKVEYTP